MEEAKKPKRPRIGIQGVNSSAPESNENRYEKVVYPENGASRPEEHASDGEHGQGGYQQRHYGYQQRQQGGYQQRPQNYQRQGQGGYQQRQGDRKSVV